MIKKLLKGIFRRARFAKPILEKVSKLECSISSWWVSNAHRRLFLIQYLIPPIPKAPKYFDHRIDLYYQWLATRNPLWVERGVFNSLALRWGGVVLELCCGDGFYTRNFYSIRAKRIIACDYDKEAIMTAIRENSAENIEYILCDIRYDMPTGKFDNIIMDGALGHFTKDETQNILENIKVRLSDCGIFSGYTIVEKESGQKSLEHHEYKFKSKEDLLEVLKPYFNNIIVFETIYPERHNLYFWASDGLIPFKEGWENMISFSREVPMDIYEKK
jgi:ubiquinone/menaquinone biosynthesis C-methylase UbiE